MKHPSHRPLIGITIGRSPKWQRGGVFYDSYAKPIERAGGECVRLYIDETGALDQCDGLLLSGGRDVHPRHYDPSVGDDDLSYDELCAKYQIDVEETRDGFELPLIEQALGRRMPILGICRGIQALNVVLAHKLIPDIESCVPNALQHKSDGSGVSISHEVSVEPGSQIEKCYGKRTLAVNTWHHQGLTGDTVSDKLRITAVASDGVVEAVEGVGGQFIVAVQWHPERAADAYIHDVSGPLFEAFVRACRRERSNQ